MPRAFRLPRLAAASAIILASISAHSPSFAQATPSVRIGTAALISPTAADTAYGSATTSTRSTSDWKCGDQLPVPPGIFTKCATEIEELARALENDPTKFYDFVRNNIATEWRYGLSKGGLGALIDRSGTAFDQTELLVELARAAGFTASYRVGTITLSGTQFSDWSGITSATAACRMLAAGGIPAVITPVGGSASTLADCSYGTASVSQIQLGHTWAFIRIGSTSYAFDPAFKGYTRDAQPALATAVGLSAGQPLAQAQINRTAGTQSGVSYVRSMNAGALNTQLQAYADNLQAWVDTNLPAGEIEDLVGGEEITRLDNPTSNWPATTLPYTSAVQRTVASPLSYPDQYRTTLRVQMTKATPQNTFPTIVDKLLYADEIYGRKLVFETEFTPLGGATSGQLALRDEFGQAYTICGSEFPGASCSFSSITDNPGFNTGDITLTVNMPYAAGVDGANNTSRAYLDTVVVKEIDYAVPFTVVHGWGDMGRGLLDKWSTRRDTPLRRPPADGCESCVSLYGSSTGDGRREQLAASWLTQSNRASRLHADLARSEFTHHYSIGVSAAQTSVSARDTNPPEATTRRYVYSISDSYDRLDVDTALSLTSRTDDASARRAAIHAIAATMAAIEGSVVQQISDLPDVSSTATRFAWGNNPPTTEDPSGGVGSRRFYRWSSSNSAQANSLARTEGKVSTTDDGEWDGNTVPEIGNVEVEGRRSQLASAIQGFTAAGYDVIASEEAFLGPGQRAGGLIPRTVNNPWLPGPATLYRHAYSRQRGGALVATRYLSGEPVQIAHIVNGPEGQDKGGGGGTQPNQQSLYDPSTAADALKARFTDRSSALGVDVRQGSLTYESPASLVVGSGDFPYQLTGQIFWRGGNVQDERFGPANHSEPQSPWSTNWNNTLTISSSGLEAMADTDIRASTSTIAAFLAMQDVYKSAVSTDREVTGPLIAAWWTQKILGNVVTASVGANSRQFLQRSNGVWFSPGTESYANLTQTGQRQIVADKPSCDLDPPQYVGTRGFTNAGMSFALRNAQGDTQNFGAWEYEAIDGQSDYCARQQGFRLNTWTFPQGVSLTLSYATQDFAPDSLVQVQNSLGRRIVFIDSGVGGFTNGLSGQDLRSVTVTGGMGAAPEHTDPAGYVTRFNVGRLGDRYRLEAVYDALNSSVPSLTYAYDRLNRVSEARDAVALREGGRNPYIFRIADGVRGQRQDPEGGKYEVLYDVDGQPFRYIDEIGRVTIAEYDGRGRVTAYQYPEGDRQQMAYNDRNQVTLMTQVDKPGGASLADLSIEASWNTTWNKPDWIEDALNRRTNFTYFGSGNGTGLISQALRPAPVGTTPRPAYNYTYTAAGLLSTETDPTSRVTRHTYNSTGDRITTIVGDVAVGAAPALDLTTTYGYNARGELTSVRDPRLNATTYVYDGMRRKTEEARRAGDITGNPVTLTRWTYDGLGRAIEERRATAFSGQTPTAWQTWLTSYTATGQTRSTTDPSGDVTRMTYDGVDRLARTTDPTFRISENVYDLAGQLLEERQGVGTPLAQTYAAYSYSGNGQRTSIIDARSNTVAMSYDEFDRPYRITFPDTTYEQQTYDDAGNVTETRTREGLRIIQTYDRLDRKIAEAGFRPDGVTPARNVEPWRMPDGSFGYDLAGRMTSANNSNVNLSWTYDAAGRALTHVRSVGGTFSYGWDAASNLETLTYPDARVATYTFDGANRTASVSLAGGSATLAYDNLGRRQSVTFGDASTQTYAYEPDDDLLSIAHVFPNGTTNNVTESFVHDAAGRTTSETFSNAAYRWSPPAGSTAYGVADALNRYPTVGGQTFTWWGDGSLKSDGSRQFQYDERRNMVTASDTAGTSVRTQRFDALADRYWAQLIRPGVLGEAILYLTDGLRPEVVMETLQTQPAGGGSTWSTTLGSRIHALGPIPDERLITIDVNNVVRYPHTDALGSTIALAAGGQMATRFRYDAYGNSPETMTFGSGAAAYPWRYTGQSHDQFTLFHHFKRREYVPTIGRFLQPDPAGFVDGPNLYQYVQNAPTTGIDPSGTQTVSGSNRLTSADFTRLREGLQELERRVVTTISDGRSETAGDYVAGVTEELVGGALEGAFGSGVAIPARAATVTTALGRGANVASAEARATAIAGTMSARTQRSVTIAVTETAEGTRVVSSSEAALRPAARAALQPGEVAATGARGTHAEVSGVNAARAAGLTPTGTAASRPICQSCAATLRTEGVQPLSPLKTP